MPSDLLDNHDELCLVKELTAPLLCSDFWSKRKKDATLAPFSVPGEGHLCRSLNRGAERIELTAG